MWRPTDENFLIVGGIDLWKTTDGGVFRAADIQAVGTEAEPPYVNGWAELVKTYGVTQFYGGGRQPASGKIVGGAQDNGTICFDPAAGSERWTTIFGGDGGWCAADPSDPGVFYGEYVYPDIHRDTDGGTTDDTQGDRSISGQFWNQATGEWDWKPVPFRIDDAKNPNSALFIAPFVPADPSTVSVAFGGYLSANIWATREGGTTWTNLAPACRRPGARDRGPTNGGRSSSTSAPRSACSRARTPVCATHGRGIFRIDLSAA